MPTPSKKARALFQHRPARPEEPELVAPDAPAAIRIEGSISDGEGEPVVDALIEIWQANQAGRYAHPEDRREELPLEDGFRGFGRCETDRDGRYAFVTVKPGPVPGHGGRMQAPHISVSVFARGLLKRLATRVYFPDELEANAADPVLVSLDARLRATLVAHQEERVLVFDIRLQGEGETAFLDV